LVCLSAVATNSASGIAGNQRSHRRSRVCVFEVVDHLRDRGEPLPERPERNERAPHASEFLRCLPSSLIPVNASSQYWFVLAAFVALTVAATVAVRRCRSASSVLYACSAWLEMIFGAGLILEPLIANETFAAPDGSATIHFNRALRRAMYWGLTFSALLVIGASATYELAPDLFSSPASDCIPDQDGG